MKIIHRYIIKELLWPFFFSLAVIMFVFIFKFIVQYIGKIFGRGLSFSTIMEFIYLNLAWMLALAVPMAVLIAALMAFGRLSADNEITIFKASGINLYQVIRPAVYAGVFLFLVMVWYNDQVLPEFNHRARILMTSISRKKPTLELEEGLYIKLKNFNILVEDIEQPLTKDISQKGTILNPNYQENGSEKLKGVIIFDFNVPETQRIVVADNGFLVFNKEYERLEFTLYDGEIHEIDTRTFSEYRRVTFAKNIFYIPASEQVFKKVEDVQRGDREMSISMMREKIEEFQNSINREKASIREEMDNYLLSPDSLGGYLKQAASAPLDISQEEEKKAVSRATRSIQALYQATAAKQRNIKTLHRQIYKYLVEIHKKFSIPFACIVFIFVGASLGIKARKGSLGVGITFSIGFFLLYWACLIGGEELADRQLMHPALAMWLPNLIVGPMGIILTIRTVRETTFIQWEKLPKALQLFFKGHED
ncbi:MAG: YjgP/YjgQ family permease [Calditrichaeota bacterium]|nr:MAG: YjgP/YjgQ family permease [Calditrichota bacterium]